MQIIFDDKNTDRSGDSYRLIRLAGGWHIVAHGYLCRVTDEGEGRQIIARLSTASSQTQPSIDKPPTGSYTSRPSCP
jgi:hypothetical protein